MDVLITYVNGLDPLWQEDYCRAVNVPAMTKRFRDWGTLKYLLRGIDRFMPYIDKVHMVVARESQIPSWIDRNNVNIVLHEDIIPDKYRPCFNSSSLEMFLHRTPGLAEQYLYFNDDMFPVMESAPEDFFKDGTAVMGYARHLICGSKYLHRVRNAWRIACKAAFKKPGHAFRRPQHTPSPMLRSVCYEVFDKVGDELYSRITPLRDNINCNQYVFTDFALLTGRAADRRLSCKHISLATATEKSLSGFLAAPDHKFVCINDVHMKDERADRIGRVMLEAFGKLFPEKSRFEL